ncbi:hypothetical protein [Arthrobacter sp. AZCC_0090]|uniref:hypothetical protein n=1 Tax=Arthrobacter sp. AZCC_0090 TaxID=2735881 RepID=UPI00161FB335|nr:hypothetical protein [Arthrobacter sp. AZCC_0090]MBB6404372.1 hypothetical protein [Arthrobacter sp. AZCC_0090]
MSAQTLPAQESRLPDDALHAAAEVVFAAAERIAVDLSDDGIVEVILPPNTVVRSPEARAAQPLSALLRKDEGCRCC